MEIRLKEGRSLKTWVEDWLKKKHIRARILSCKLWKKCMNWMLKVFDYNSSYTWPVNSDDDLYHWGRYRNSSENNQNSTGTSNRTSGRSTISQSSRSHSNWNGSTTNKADIYIYKWPIILTSVWIWWNLLPSRTTWLFSSDTLANGHADSKGDLEERATSPHLFQKASLSFPPRHSNSCLHLVIRSTRPIGSPRPMSKQTIDDHVYFN